MKQVYTDWKTDIFKYFQDEDDLNKHKIKLLELRTYIPRVYYVPKESLPEDMREGPSLRGSIFNGNWLECCTKYKYPGKEILDEIGKDKMTTFDEDEKDDK